MTDEEINCFKENAYFSNNHPYNYTKTIVHRRRGEYLIIFAEDEVNIGEYLPRRSRRKYSPIFTEPEANNCFSVIFSGEYQESETR